MSDVFEKLDFGSKEQKSSSDYSEMHTKSSIDLDVVPPRPPLALSIGRDERSYNGYHYPLRFGTFGNISMIKGEEKARKSFLKSLLLACAIGGNANNYSDDIIGHGLRDKYIIDIDTEQDEYDAWLNASRIPKMVGAIPENYISIKLREYNSEEVSGYLEWLFMESEYRSNLGIVSIDGFVDCMKDFNSLSESIEFTKRLMRYSSLTKSHITGVLHLNPNSDKARGHLGTILQQKCETVVIIKDMGEYSMVTCQRGRGKKFKPFTIRIDDEWLPYVSDDDVMENGIVPIKKVDF
ncbi:hypothetical protein [Flagellimonas nanhaiensis]|uniref:Mobilization protein n=1 Tax=Flagellimonas nanhaiensis TaxID=2292706 RepID=A0A371JNV6_9FLAO|nr:hypothetical protein [Allomuricauda nanhaiensis]RDY58912.1 hypothetical protein DX873_14735 [Allomuricauda nanhaiensis]